MVDNILKVVCRKVCRCYDYIHNNILLINILLSDLRSQGIKHLNVGHFNLATDHGDKKISLLEYLNNVHLDIF